MNVSDVQFLFPYLALRRNVTKEMEALVEKALNNGWMINHQNLLVGPKDHVTTRNTWAAEYKPVEMKSGRKVFVPHWLPEFFSSE